MKKKLYLQLKVSFLSLLVGCLIGFNMQAQESGVSINSTGNLPDPSAILDLSSTSKGFLLPRMSTSDRDLISNPAEGLQIFNTTSKCFEAFIENDWYTLSCPGVCHIPSPAGLITGSPIVCAGQNEVTYSITAVNDATGYVWSLPTGASISSGLGTPSITANFGNNTTDGVINVYATNGCGNGIISSNYSVTVTPLPPATGEITGTTIVCQGQNNVSYTVTPVIGATSYTWNLPAGATIDSGDNTEHITVNYSLSATDGNITTIASNSCGLGVSSPSLNIEVNEMTPGSQTFLPTASIETFTVPSCVYSITITAKGAQGGNTTPDGVGGKGASIKGTFSVNPGEQYKILVGKQGENSTNNAQVGAGGGGGSYVWNNETSSLLIAAGGGGGSAIQANGGGGSGSGSGYNNGAYGSATVTPTAPPAIGSGGAGGSAGNGGNGGLGNTPTFNFPRAGGGAGWVGNGGNGGSGGGNAGGVGGKRPLEGGQGGIAGGGWGKNGGFGGGGGGAGIAGGGGGGYNGGGGGTGLSQPTGIVSSGGGGGSYNNGTDQLNNANTQTGDSLITITW